MNNFEKETCDLLRARFPYIHITTYEETRLIKELTRIVSTPDLINSVRKVYVWKSSEGFKDSNGMIQEDTYEKIQALNFVRKCEEDALFIFLDFHVFCKNT